jgi:alpha-L-rhamnosidase
MKKTIALVVMLAVMAVGSIHGQVAIVHPTVEYQDGSQPLATNVPRFSWRYETDDSINRWVIPTNVKQTSYRIIVASTRENAEKNIGDLWDTKTIASDRILLIPYEGKPLHSRDKAYWKVITSTTRREVTSVKHYRDSEFINESLDTVTLVRFIESSVNSFEISLLDITDWKAKWIGGDFYNDDIHGKTRIASRYLRKEFSLTKNIREARLYVSGLGQYSAYLNGKEVAPEEILKPALSDYTKRVYFNAYDVTDFLKKGSNAVGVTLAGGRYTTIRYDEKEMEYGGLTHAKHFGTPRLLLQLEVTYTDGSKELIVSDKSWKITDCGPIRKSNEFDGETYDERYNLGAWTLSGYNDKSWYPARVVDAPGGKVVPQPNPNIKVQDTLRPVAMFRKGDAWILDMGQNMVGYLNMELNASCVQNGDTITLRFAELLKPDSTLYVDNLRSAEATDRYIVSSVETRRAASLQWHPMFTYHGFRYVEITGLREEPKLKDFQGLVFYDEMATTGSFECSNEIMNAVYRNAYWGIRGNYRSMPTDCPQRDERMGWTGDRTTGNYGESYIFNNYRLYSKWLYDIEDTEEPTGSLSDVCPNYWRRITDNMTWPGAFITVADMLYTRYGDIEAIRAHYPAMKHWMEHMRSKYGEDGVITRDCYGDWCVPPESPELIHSNDPLRHTEGGSISTPFYCHLCDIMARFAELLYLPDDADYFRFEKRFSTNAYNDRYFDPGTMQYDNGSVTANLLPLTFGMVPEEWEEYVFANILDKTENDFSGHVSTGVVGIQQLMRTLTDRGRGDLALKIATNDTYPSWGYMVRNGATTIWELWNGNTADPAMNSGNHVMLLGDLILWEYEYLGGIRALEPGYSKIQLKPTIIPGLDYVKCSYESVSGRIESSWNVYKGHYEWSITIPANTEAEVWIPTSSGYLKQIVGSGSHNFAFWLQ